MNERLSFRAWNQEWDKMIYSTSAHDWFGKRDFSPWLMDVGFSHYPTDGWVIMQCTGLRDRNGAQIYEGDILLWEKSDLRSPDTLMGVVKWTYDRYDVYVKNFGVWYLSAVHDRGCEIIGNIHDNPELLEGGEDK